VRRLKIERDPKSSLECVSDIYNGWLYSHAFTKLRVGLGGGCRRHIDAVVPSIVILLLLLILTTMTSMMTSTVDALETADDLQADEHKDAPSPAQHHGRRQFTNFSPFRYPKNSVHLFSDLSTYDNPTQSSRRHEEQTTVRHRTLLVACTLADATNAHPTLATQLQ